MANNNVSLSARCRQVHPDDIGGVVVALKARAKELGNFEQLCRLTIQGATADELVIALRLANEEMGKLPQATISGDLYTIADTIGEEGRRFKDSKLK
jgi:hypothetical protein